MSEDARHRTETDAIANIRKFAGSRNAAELVQEILSGDRNALSQAITLLESASEKHTTIAADIIHGCLPHAGKSLRIGITGVPGVGKSTFIDAFGKHLLLQNKKVAVLAIDPSSPVSGGSILGDKTRMEKLSADNRAFIRPSPSAQTLGGVTRKTRETIILCEAAGFDIIIVETVGVGQSETAVYGMTDFFLLLMLAGAGDQLQGIKRGIMEMCDAMLITKADGENVKKAQYAKSEFTSALHLFPAKETGWQPRVEVSSAVEQTGIAETWNIISEHESWMKERGLFEMHRHAQDITWMQDSIREKLVSSFFADTNVISKMKEAEELLRDGKMTPFAAAELVMKAWR